MAVYPIAFRPSAPSDLFRMGAEFDGGYVLSRRIPPATKGLLSFGLCDEWTFEKQFCSISGIPLVCFDPSVGPRFWVKKFLAGLVKGLTNLDLKRLKRGFRGIDYLVFFDGVKKRHVRKAIGYQGRHSVTLSQAIAEASLPEPLFLKMDIEGWEYRILPELAKLRQKFVGFAIEFHDIDLHEQRISTFIDDIRDSFILIHFHANSHTVSGPDGYSRVVEMSFMNRKLLHPEEELSAFDLPIPGLDSPNLPEESEAVVSFSST